MDTVAYDRSSQALRALHTYQIGGLPLLQPLLTALQVRGIVNEVVPSQADVELGQLVVLLVLNRLLAPQPLYEIQGWLAETVLPEVLGMSDRILVMHEGHVTGLFDRAEATQEKIMTAATQTV